MKKIVFFVLAIAISVIAAAFRWPDSAHAIATLSMRGGSVRHPVHLSAGKGRYVIILTARVLPPYRGNARMVLEGKGNLEYSFHQSRAIINLKLKDLPEYEKGVFYNLKPGDRLSMWIRLKAKTEVSGKYELVFYDVKTKKRLLTLPIIFEEEEKE